MFDVVKETVIFITASLWFADDMAEIGYHSKNDIL